MEIKVIGGGCDRCGQLYENVLQAVQALGLDAHVEKVEDLVEIVKLGVMTAPAVMVDGRLVTSGRVLKPKKLMELLKQP